MEYLTILLSILVATFLVQKSFHIQLYRTAKERFFTVFAFFVLGTLWDTFAIWRGHWIFPPGKTLGINIGLMPIEEYLFMLVIPYAIITVYKVHHSIFFAQKKRGRR